LIDMVYSMIYSFVISYHMGKYMSTIFYQKAAFHPRLKGEAFPAVHM